MLPIHLSCFYKKLKIKKMEATTSKKASLEAFVSLYDFHTRLFVNVIDCVSEADAQNRLNTKANHIAWLAGSLVHERYELANCLGIDLHQTSDELFFNHKGIQDEAIYPPLDELRKDWQEITPILREAYSNLSEEQLGGPDPFGMPGGDYTLFDTITFCTDRESYCLGQLGLWRRLLGYAAAKYD
jgi:hypothetical protein